MSVSYKTDILIIRADSDVFKDEDNTGEYIIGILGFQECTYQIEVTFANLTIYTLDNG